MVGSHSSGFDQATAFCKVCRRPVLMTHAKPDGDALGSLLAMNHLLRAQGSTPTCLLYEALPDMYAQVCVGDFTMLDQTNLAAQLNGHDSVIVLDTCAYGQLSPVEDWLRASSLPKLAVDHHVTRDALADVYLVDESAAACCLILYDWACSQGWPISPETAQALLVGIATDTGWFHHSNTDSRVFAAAGALVAQGTDCHALYAKLYERESIARIRLVGEALSSLAIYGDDCVAVMTLSAEAFMRAGASLSDTESIINEPLRIQSIIVSVLLVEQADGQTRVSFRSKQPLDHHALDVDVASLASTFGGGGHRRAAGARFEGKPGEVKDRVVAEVMRVLGG